MAKITVNSLTTQNTVPTITGTAKFDRFDNLGNPKEAIEVILNYRPFYLYEGNLGLDKTAIDGTYTWKLHVDSPLYPGTYDVEANVYTVADDIIIASDNTRNELTILPPPMINGVVPQKSIAQKAATVAALMGALQNLFGNSGVGGPSPSIYPTQDDQSSSSLAARGSEERSEDPRVKSKKKVVDEAPVPPPKHNFESTDNGSVDSGQWELASLDKAREENGDAAAAQADSSNSGELPVTFSDAPTSASAAADVPSGISSVDGTGMTYGFGA